MRHLGITGYSHDFGWDDNERKVISRECDVVGYSIDEKEIS